MSGLATSYKGPRSHFRARGVLRRAGLHAIWTRIRNEFFENFCGENIFASDFTRDRAKIRVAYRCAATVPVRSTPTIDYNRRQTPAPRALTAHDIPRAPRAVSSHLECFVGIFI